MSEPPPVPVRALRAPLPKSPAGAQAGPCPRPLPEGPARLHPPPPGLRSSPPRALAVLLPKPSSSLSLSLSIYLSLSLSLSQCCFRSQVLAFQRPAPGGHHGTPTTTPNPAPAQPRDHRGYGGDGAPENFPEYFYGSERGYYSTQKRIPQKFCYVIAPGAITGFSCKVPENNSKIIFPACNHLDSEGNSWRINDCKVNISGHTVIKSVCVSLFWGNLIRKQKQLKSASVIFGV